MAIHVFPGPRPPGDTLRTAFITASRRRLAMVLQKGNAAAVLSHWPMIPPSLDVGAVSEVSDDDASVDGQSLPEVLGPVLPGEESPCVGDHPRSTTAMSNVRRRAMPQPGARRRQRGRRRRRNEASATSNSP